MPRYALLALPVRAQGRNRRRRRRHEGANALAAARKGIFPCFSFPYNDLYPLKPIKVLLHSRPSY